MWCPMTVKKSVSIVLPVYNEKDSIEKVILSIYENVYTKLDDAEFIVAEDGHRRDRRDTGEAKK